jgi:hypothetical protein
VAAHVMQMPLNDEVVRSFQSGRIFKVYSGSRSRSVTTSAVDRLSSHAVARGILHTLYRPPPCMQNSCAVCLVLTRSAPARSTASTSTGCTTCWCLRAMTTTCRSTTQQRGATLLLCPAASMAASMSCGAMPQTSWCLPLARWGVAQLGGSGSGGVGRSGRHCTQCKSKVGEACEGLMWQQPIH